jgi:hypothetical protein
MGDDEDILVATNDFLATGGDGFAGAKLLTPVDESPVLRDALADYFHAHPAPLHARDWYKSDAPRLPTEKRPLSCP